MSLPEVRGAGKLVTDPRSGETKTGGRWTNGLIRFQSWRKTGDDWEPGDAVVASVIGFDEVADQLAGYAKGDDVAVQGVTSVGIWKEQPQLKITLSRVWKPERRKGGSQASTPRGQDATKAAQNARTPGQSTTVDRGEPHRRNAGAAAPTDLDAYRRETGTRLLRQHAGNAQRAGRLV